MGDVPEESGTDAQGSAASTESVDEQTSQPRRRWVIWAAIGAALVLIVGIGTGIALTRDAPAISGSSPSPSASETPTTTPTPGSSETPSASPSPSAAPEIIVDEFGRETQAPVPIEQPADPVKGMTVSLVSIEAIAGEAAGPGEVSGPAIRVTVSVANQTDEDQTLQFAIVNAYYGANLTPANTFQSTGGADPLIGSVAQGKTATGVYVFSVPESQRGNVRIEVDINPDLRVVLFEGAVP